MKQAGIIATYVIMKVIDYGMTLENKKMLLTPLAGAVFSTLSVPSISKILGMTQTKVLKTMCASSQSSGHLLQDSDINCAAACVLVATRNVKDSTIRSSIIEKTMKQYMSAQKEMSVFKIFIWLYFATGGIPEELTVIGLNKLNAKVVQSRKATATGVTTTDKEQIKRFFEYQVGKGDKAPQKHFDKMTFSDDIDLEQILLETFENMKIKDKFVTGQQSGASGFAFKKVPPIDLSDTFC